ncbi:MAG TPA: hypothetical protein VMU81_10360, partial [Acetobacteraceae bacterium]|nr:hypothetical protein [Acetobacteraceae bacterium]
GGESVSGDFGSAWDASGGGGAFVYTTSVTVPASVPLLGAAMVGIGAARWRESDLASDRYFQAVAHSI